MTPSIVALQLHNTAALLAWRVAVDIRHTQFVTDDPAMREEWRKNFSGALGQSARQRVDIELRHRWRMLRPLLAGIGQVDHYRPPRM